jgi:hemolysin D
VKLPSRQPSPSAPLLRRQELAFLPAALELQATPPSPLGRKLLWSLLLLLATVLGWSVWARIDIVTTAPGQVIPSGRVKLVQPFEPGVVAAIHVRDGDRVEQGQLLVELDSTEPGALLRQVEDELDATRQQLERLARLRRSLESGGRDEGERAGLGRAQAALLVHERDEHRARLARLAGERRQREAELETVAARLAGLRDVLALVTRRSTAHAQLATVGHVATEAWLKVEQERRSLEAELGALEGNRRSLATALVTLDRTRDAYLAERLREVTDAQVTATRQLATLEQEQARAEARLARHRLTAPVSGRVQQLAVHTLGGVVTPAQELLRIVPDDGQLEIEARVLNRDSAEVHAGMPAVVKIDAYPFTRHGTLAAEIVALSADALADQALGLVYLARVRLADIAGQGQPNLHLEPGMAVTVEIRTGERRVIELLLNPLVRAMKEAGRER